MRRITALCAASGIALAALVVAAPAEAGYYVIRWDNTGICQIWNEELQYKPGGMAVALQGGEQAGGELQ